MRYLEQTFIVVTMGWERRRMGGSVSWVKSFHFYDEKNSENGWW
jgi:hypothetical protein